MASKQRADKQKEKEKKEKIILVALVAVLVIVGAFELPKMLKKSGGSSSSAVTTGQTISTSSTTSSSGTPGSTSPAIESLPNSIGYQANAGQLSGFSLFNTKDPFGSVTTSSSTNSTSPTNSTNPTNPTNPTNRTATSSTTTRRSTTESTTTTPAGQYVAATISVNGSSEVVALDATFPSASPVFVLESVTAKKIEISVAGGAFSSGQSKVAVGKGKSVVLVNTIDSTRYVIKFVTALTESQASSTTNGATTSDTTTSDTTTSDTTTSGTTENTTT
jgi:hypothetical protein